MEFKSFFSAITKPEQRIDELLADPSQAESLKPGLIWVAWVQVAFGVLLLAVAFAFWSLYAVVVASMGPGFFGRLAPGLMDTGFLTPVQLLLWTVRAWLVAVLAAMGAVWALDAFMSKKAGVQGGKQVLVFNLMTKLLVPWQVFIVIPVLGWIVMVVGGVFNTYRVIRKVYAPESTNHKVLGVAGYYITSFVGSFVAALLVGALMSPLSRLDPMANWAATYKAKALGIELPQGE